MRQNSLFSGEGAMAAGTPTPPRSDAESQSSQTVQDVGFVNFEPQQKKLTPPHIFDQCTDSQVPNRIVLTMEQGELTASFDGVNTVVLDLSHREIRDRLQALLWHKTAILTNDMEGVHRTFREFGIYAPYPQYKDVPLMASMLGVSVISKRPQMILSSALAFCAMLDVEYQSDDYYRHIQMKIIAIEMEQSGIPCDMGLLERHATDKDKYLVASLKRGYSHGRIRTIFSFTEGSWRLKCEDVAVLNIPNGQIRKAMRTPGKKQVFADLNIHHVRLVAERSGCPTMAKLLEQGMDLPQYTFDSLKGKALDFVPKVKGRDLCKRLLHATNNGGGGPAFKKAFGKLDIEVPATLDLRQLRREIFNLFPGISRVQREVKDAAEITTLLGRKIAVGDGTLGEKVSMFLLGTETDLMAEMAWAVRTSCSDIPGFTLNLCWHDAIYTECNPGYEDQVAESLARAMENLPKKLGLKTPFKTKVVISDSWSLEDGKVFNREEYQFRLLTKQLKEAESGEYMSLGSSTLSKLAALSPRNQDLMEQIYIAEQKFSNSIFDRFARGLA